MDLRQHEVEPVPFHPDVPIAGQLNVRGLIKSMSRQRNYVVDGCKVRGRPAHRQVQHFATNGAAQTITRCQFAHRQAPSPPLLYRPVAIGGVVMLPAGPPAPMFATAVGAFAPFAEYRVTIW